MPPYHDGDLTRMRAFRDWCLSALRASGDFDGVDLFHAPNSLAANDAIIAPNPRRPTAAVWTCLASDDPDHGFLATVNRLFATVRAQPSLRHCRLVLASPDDLGDPRVRGVEVYDARVWLESWDGHRRWADGIGVRLGRLLRQRQRMPAGAQGKTTDMLTRDLFRFVCPVGWYPERDDVLGPGVRPDAVLAATANAPSAVMSIDARRLIVESCDLGRPVGPGAFHRLAEYLHRSGPTTVGVLASRGPVGPTATDVWRRLAASGVQVYHVDDAILHAMLRAHLARLEGDTTRDPWAVMRFAQAFPP